MTEANGKTPSQRLRPSSKSIVPEQPFYAPMNDLRTKARNTLIGRADAELFGHSWRMMAVGSKRRKKFAEAFILLVEVGGESEEEYREACRNVGIAPALIFLLLSIAWQILWYWFTHRTE